MTKSGWPSGRRGGFEGSGMIALAEKSGKDPSIFLHVAGVMAITIVVIAGTIYHNGKSHRRSAELITEQFNQQQLILARSISKGIETFIRVIDDDLLALSQFPDVQRMEPGMLKQMRALFMGFPRESSSRRLDRNGVLRFIYHNDSRRKDIIGWDYSREEYFKEARDKNNVVVSGLLINEAGKRRIRVARPVYSDSEKGEKEFDGVVVCSFDPAELAGMYVDPVISGDTGYAWLINEEGTFLAHNEKEFPGQDAFTVRRKKNPQLSYERINDIQKLMLAGKEGTDRYFSGWHRKEEGEIEKLIAYTPVHVFDKIWSVAVSVKAYEAQKIVNKAYRHELYVVGSIIFILTVGSIFSLVSFFRWRNSLAREMDMLRESEEALQRSEQKFRDMAENTTDCMWEVNPQGVFTYAGPRIKDLVGYEAEELLGKTPFGLIAKRNRDEAMVFFKEKVMKGEAFFDIETTNQHKDGHLVVMETSGMPIFDENGQLEGYRGITREITERSRMLKVLRESEEKFRVISEGSADGILVVDIKSGKIIYANPAFCNMLGYYSDELMTMKIADINPEQDSNHIVDGLEALMSGDIAQVHALRWVRKDGEIVWADISSKKIMYRERECVVGFFRDITQRKRIHEALQESEARHRLLVETMSDGLGLLDKDGVFTYVNDRFFQILTCSRDEILGRSVFDFFDDANRIIMEEHWIWRRKRQHSGYEIVWNGKNGRRVPTIFSMAPIFDADGHLEGNLAVITDITENKKDQEEVQKSLRQLQKLMNSTIHAIAKIVEIRDPYISGHQVRVAQLARAIARELNLSEERIKGLYVASVIHDIGKIAVPAEILSKPGRQSESEVNIIKDHPQISYDILKSIQFPWPVAEIVAQHHERFDGSGYPKGLSGEEIILEARILGVADVVESMSTHRPYRPSLGIDKALEEISMNSGILYDPVVVDACLKLYADKEFSVLDDQREIEAIVW